ncbi:helix-turn-helix domain-containing protein [Pedobacter sp. BMA]|uniref:winged helix-turn-helix transcriptional regulator n=1 Tax=Pedobacter sp. BMA TaxID=1663685 RepID=UPI000649926E|nr:helix-turn-helix domain-containing protein [Pedobacter sp. BMA]KLT63847.1 HxlR family transcriptional regulator [Pedobacter sp. BMA]
MNQTEGVLNNNDFCNSNIRAIHDTMYVIGGKWKISIVACLGYRPMRFSELLREVEGIAGKVLSRELKDMETNQLIVRKVLDTKPISVLYHLTEYGKTLEELTLTIAEWGKTHRKQIIGK